jgi:DNA primase
VLGLWAKMPPTGDAVCICSSVKDALCLMANIHIPCICLQGEGYPISDTAAKELKRRFKDVFICLDNDEAGLKDAFKLSESTGFINVVIPSFDEGKDISDYYRAYGETSFKTFFGKLISEAREEYYNELPF